MDSGRHTGHAAGENFAALGDESLEKLRVLVVDGLDVEVDAAPGHRAVGAAEVRAALWCFGLHGWLFDLAMEGVTVKERVEFLFFEPVRGARALFVARGDVARGGFAFGLRLGAFEGDVFLCHCRYSLDSVGASSSSPSPSSSFNPKREVTGWRTRWRRLFFSSSAWHSTV